MTLGQLDRLADAAGMNAGVQNGCAFGGDGGQRAAPGVVVGDVAAPDADLGRAYDCGQSIINTTTAVTSESVKHLIAPKGPLKGKGGTLAQWHRQAAQDLADVHAAMAVVASATGEIHKHEFKLIVFRGRAPARQLRWRMNHTAKQHTVWERVEPRLAQLSPVMAKWYREVQELAMVLNHKEQVARYALKTVNRLIDGRERLTRLYKDEVSQ